MAQQSPNSSRPNSNLPKTKQIDLRGQATYAASVEWVRSNLVLGKTPKGSVLQLDVLLPNGTVALFMDPWNQYILGFRGADAVYVLKDDKSDEFADALRAAFKNLNVVPLNIGAGHGPEGLATFNGHGNWPKAREFSHGDLREAQILSTFSKSAKNIDHTKLQKALSLFVHMISESARIPTLESSFTYRFYLGSPVSADLAVRSVNKAKLIIEWSQRLFPNEQRYEAVERLQKRAAHMDLLLTRLEAALKRKDRASLFLELLDGHSPPDRTSAAYAKEFCEVAKELKLKSSDVKSFTEVITTCRSDDAVFAAKQGVATPEITRNI
jgi:hypothetical protein